MRGEAASRCLNSKAALVSHVTVRMDQICGTVPPSKSTGANGNDAQVKALNDCKPRRKVWN